MLVHPTDPPGVDLMDMGKFDLSWSVGFMFDTTLAFTRMIFDGFFDLYPNLKLIASHGGGSVALPGRPLREGRRGRDPVAAEDEGASRPIICGTSIMTASPTIRAR